jgi:hypothetical protein
LGNLFLNDKLLNLWLKLLSGPTHIFLVVSGVLGRGELSFSMSLGTEEVFDMLSPVSSVSPVLWLSKVDIEARCFSLRFSFFFFFSFFFWNEDILLAHEII